MRRTTYQLHPSVIYSLASFIRVEAKKERKKERKKASNKNPPSQPAFPRNLPPDPPKKGTQLPLGRPPARHESRPARAARIWLVASWLRDKPPLHLLSLEHVQRPRDLELVVILRSTPVQRNNRAKELLRRTIIPFPFQRDEKGESREWKKKNEGWLWAQRCRFPCNN